MAEGFADLPSLVKRFDDERPKGVTHCSTILTLGDKMAASSLTR